MADPKRIVVVGGGVAGLAAARAALLRARERKVAVSVTVLERTPRFGGVLVTERVDGFLLDAGADSWVVAKPHATALARALGLGGELLGTRLENRRFYIGWGDRLHLVPDGLVLGIPTRIGPLVRTRLFSWRGKARMGLEPFIPARRFDGDDDESIADFAARRLGREAADRLVAPLLGGISAGDASEMSVRAGFPQLVAMEREHGSLVRGMLVARRARSGESPFMSMEGGTGALVDGLVDRLRDDGVTLRGQATVEGLTREGTGPWTVRLEGGERLEADAVLLAVPAHAASKLVAGPRRRGGPRALDHRLWLDGDGVSGLPAHGRGPPARRRRLRRAARRGPLDPREHLGLEQVGRARAGGSRAAARLLGGPSAAGLLDGERRRTSSPPRAPSSGCSWASTPSRA